MPTGTLDKPMTKEESYVERRQLFKNIWHTAMHIEDKEDIMNKTKVVKTLRMDEIDKCPIGKTKKQRIKNLRHVCNRILDFCDHQDADDKFYEQVTTEGNLSPPKLGTQITKKVKIRPKKKVRKAKSMFVPQTKIKIARVSTSERQEGNANTGILTNSLVKRKIVTTKSALLKKKSVKIMTSDRKADDFPKETTMMKRKVVKKKRGKKKRTSLNKTGPPKLNIISV